MKTTVTPEIRKPVYTFKFPGLGYSARARAKLKRQRLRALIFD